MSAAIRPSLFANRNFTLLFGGSTISAIGDQFTLVALPWLVLKLTGDPAALGLVLAAMALPRAAFMLIGGVVADRIESGACTGVKSGFSVWSKRRWDGPLPAAHAGGQNQRA